MEFKMKNNMIYLKNEEDKVIAEVTFPVVEDGVVDIDHTFVDDSLRGQGVAGKLMVAAYNKIKEDGNKAKTSCWYAREWYEKHSEYQDILYKEQ